MNRRYVGSRNIPRSTSAPQVIAHPGSALNLRSNEVALQHDSKLRAQRHAVGSRWRGTTCIVQGARRLEPAILCAEKILAPQPHAPGIFWSKPLDGGIRHSIAQLTQTIVRTPRKSAVLVIADDEVEAPAWHLHSIGSTDIRSFFGRSDGTNPVALPTLCVLPPTGSPFGPRVGLKKTAR